MAHLYNFFHFKAIYRGYSSTIKNIMNYVAES
jgi:hypothetical protein